MLANVMLWLFRTEVFELLSSARSSSKGRILNEAQLDPVCQSEIELSGHKGSMATAGDLRDVLEWTWEKDKTPRSIGYIIALSSTLYFKKVGGNTNNTNYCAMTAESKCLILWFN